MIFPLLSKQSRYLLSILQEVNIEKSLNMVVKHYQLLSFYTNTRNQQRTRKRNTTNRAVLWDYFMVIVHSDQPAVSDGWIWVTPANSFSHTWSSHSTSTCRPLLQLAKRPNERASWQYWSRFDCEATVYPHISNRGLFFGKRGRGLNFSSVRIQDHGVFW